MQVTNKFGGSVATLPGQRHCNLSEPVKTPANTQAEQTALDELIAAGDPQDLFAHFRDALPVMDYDRLRGFVDEVAAQTTGKNPALGIAALTLAIDRRYPTGDKKRSSVLTIVRGGLERIFQGAAAV